MKRRADEDETVVEGVRPVAKRLCQEEVLIQPKPKARSASWLALDAFYESNKAIYDAPTPQLFGPPGAGAPAALRYMSSAEFDAHLANLGKRITGGIRDDLFDEAVLWLPAPGKSNFWVTLRCWPNIRERIDHVRPCWGDTEPYDTHKNDVCHVWIDDILFTGEQMRKTILQDLVVQPPVGYSNTWLVAAVGMSAQSRACITAGITKLDECAEFSIGQDGDVILDPDDEADGQWWDPGFEFVYEYDLVRNPADMRYYFYTGYKVADNFSIPLIELVEGGYIPGADKANLSAPLYAIPTLERPLAPYKGMKLVGEDDLVRDLPRAKEWHI